MKKIVSVILSFVLLFSLVESTALAIVSIDDTSVTIKQTGERCTIDSIGIMFRRKAILDGNDNWSSITEKSLLNKTGFPPSNDAEYVDSAKGLNMKTIGKVLYRMQNNNYKRNQNVDNMVSDLKLLLDKYPEGIVLYVYEDKESNKGEFQHAVLLTRYDGANFYCMDPANNVPNGEINLMSSALADGDHANTSSVYELLSYSVKVWYISSSSNESSANEIMPSVDDKPATDNSQIQKCGDDAYWSLDNGILTIDGTGAIERYQPWSAVPWYPYAAKIKHVVFGDGITEINQTLFFGCNQIKSISFGNGIKEINNGLLLECDDSIEKILIGKGIKTIGYKFNENVSIYYAGSESEWNNINFFDEVSEYTIKNPYPISFGCSKLPGIDSFADDGIQVIVKNSFLSMDQPPIVKDSRTLVPLRAIFEALDAFVEWNNFEQKVTATKGATTIWLVIGDKTLHINEKTITLDVPAQIVNGRTLIPVRAVAEALDCTVNWNGDKKYVIIIPKNEKNYRIDAVNTKGEILSSAHFNAGGLIESIDSFGYYDWFLPFYANINGNFYLQDINLLPLNSTQIRFEYQNGNVSKITTGNIDINYKYDSNNKVISNGAGVLYVNEEIKNNGYVFKENILGLVNKFYPENEEHLHHGLLYDARGKVTTYQMNTDLHTYEYNDDGSLYCSYYQEYTPGEDAPYKTKEKVFYKYIIE